MNSKLLFFVFIIFCSCTPAKFIVESKESTLIKENCIAKLKPINKRAKELNLISIVMNDSICKVNDTLALKRGDIVNN